MDSTHDTGADLAPRLAARHAALKCERPGLAGTGASMDQGAANSHDSALTDAERKRRATLTARAARLGLVLEVLHDGACVLMGEPGKGRALPSVPAAEAMVWGIELVRAEVSALMAARRPGSAR